MDLLLINPPREIPQHADFPPMGLAYIASYLKQHGITVRVLDAASFSWKQLQKAFKIHAPRIVGIPCWTVEREQSFRAAKLVKTVLPESKLIMGGHHATSFPAHMFRLAGTDAVVIGEGEITSLELVKAMLADEDLGNVRGIAYIKEGEVVFTEPRPLIEDLDSLPFPCHDDFNLDEYLGLPENKGRACSIMTSRGCPHKCIYCSGSNFWHRKWRPRSPENVLDEIEWVYKDLNVRNILFFDDNFTVNKERAIKICEGIIERGLNIKWVAESHVSHINRELLEWMKKSGCYRIDFGVESGSPRILKTVQKKQTVEQIEEAFKLTHEAGIKPRAYLMVGNPGEDEETIKETAAFMKKIKPWDTLGAHPLLVLPSTKVYEMAKAKGIIDDDYWLNHHGMMYYTAEHSPKELQALRELLMRELAMNHGGFNAYARYLLRKMYYRYPVLQKLRKWKGVVSERVAQ
jgi:anaerobic magnesium-protoporphyrin IX monomethyl ester cyclase